MPFANLSEQAEDDLAEIWAYIAMDNISAADRTIAKSAPPANPFPNSRDLDRSVRNCFAACEVSQLETTSSSTAPRAMGLMLPESSMANETSKEYFESESKTHTAPQTFGRLALPLSHS